MIPSLTVIDTRSESQELTSYKNVPIALVNDHVVRLSIMTEAYYWHYHPNSDEVFLVIEGIVCIDLEDRTVELLPGQMFAVPANVRHRTWPQGERSVNITFELAGMETVLTPT